MKVLVLMGATATGKSGLAIAAARTVGREIVSADSRQIYRGLRIGTAQPTATERADVTYHLVDFLPIDRSWSAQEFSDAALELIRTRPQTPPIVVGGTGFWLRSLMEGLFPLDIPREATLATRKVLEADGTDVLYDRLCRQDAITAERLHPNDRQRILRALEVLDATGERLSDHHRKARNKPEGIVWKPLLLTLPRAELHRRIESRLDTMLDGGWPEEVAALLDAGVDSEAPGMKALGYPEIVAMLRGELSRVDARERILQRTRQYARRQEIWFRREEAERVDPREPSTATRLAQLLSP